MDKFKLGFLKTLVIIREYLPQIVIGGGWVPLIYYHYLVGDKTRNPIRTMDIDLYVKKNIPVIGSRTLDQILTEAGLRSTFKSRDVPPVIHYEGKIDDFDVEIEFLTDQAGSREDPVIEVQKGLHAEVLRYIIISLDNVMTLTVDDLADAGLQPLEVNVPTPAAYIFHKGLVFQRRKNRNKKAKDLYYIFDILSNLSDHMDAVHDDLGRLKTAYEPWFNRFLSNLDAHFSSMEAEGVQLVSEQRPPNTMPRLTDDQFRAYIYGTFRELIKRI